MADWSINLSTDIPLSFKRMTFSIFYNLDHSIFFGQHYSTIVIIVVT